MPPPYIYFINYTFFAIAIFLGIYLVWQVLRDQLKSVKSKVVKKSVSVVPTRCDYSADATILGSGNTYGGSYKFYVAICPRCNNNDEHDGCCNCRRHDVYIKAIEDKRFLICRTCGFVNTMETECSVCGAYINRAYINFYEGRLPVRASAVVEASIVRGPGRPEVAIVEHLEMPTKPAPVEENFSSLN